VASIRHVWKRFTCLLASGEYFDVLIRSCRRCFPSRLLQLRKHYIIRIESRPAEGRPSNVLGSVKRADLADLPGILNCLEVPNGSGTEKVFRDFWRMRNDCFVLESYHDAKVAGLCWMFSDRYVLTYAEYASENIIFCLPEDAAFIGNAYVRPDSRRQGVYSALLAGVVNKLGWPTRIRQILAAVECENDESRNVHAKNGFVAVAVIYYVSFCCAAFVIVRPLQGRPFVARLRSQLMLRVTDNGAVSPVRLP